MARQDFSKAVKREALKRSGMLCEAVGARYGLPPGKRCNAPLSRGVEFDHSTPDGLTGEPTLANCVAACPVCHAWKTQHIDIPAIAKAKRQSDRHQGIRVVTPSPIQGAPFPTTPKSLRRMKQAAEKRMPPRQPMFRPAQEDAP